MSHYIFSFKKGDISLELESSDSRFVYQQVNVWLEEVAGISLDKNVKQTVKKETKNSKVEKKPLKIEKAEEIEEIEEVVSEKVDEIAAQEESSEIAAKEEAILVVPQVAEEPVIIAEDQLQETVEQEPTVIASEIVQEAEEIEEADEIILNVKTEETEEIIESVEKTINNVANEIKEPQIEEVVAEIIQDEDSNEEINVELNDTPVIEEEISETSIKAVTFSERIKESKKIDEATEIQEETSSEDTLIQTEEVITEPIEENITEEQKDDKFHKILQEKFSSLPNMINNSLSKKLSAPTPNTESELKTIQDFINVKKPESLLDYLVITAYYLKQYDMLDRYSLKQMNAKILAYVKKPIDHSVIQEAVAKNLLEVVPDYTGMADVTEYSITQEGENYLLNEL